ncbi:Uncharacterized protein APZ42_001428 [Daphnia magna]|nr:Uncharacterized protein APZ42_001428 [Daphnia magna]
MPSYGGSVGGGHGGQASGYGGATGAGHGGQAEGYGGSAGGGHGAGGYGGSVGGGYPSAPVAPPHQPAPVASYGPPPQSAGGY